MQENHSKVPEPVWPFISSGLILTFCRLGWVWASHICEDMYTYIIGILLSITEKDLRLKTTRLRHQFNFTIFEK
jgi:hypothetical protein